MDITLTGIFWWIAILAVCLAVEFRSIFRKLDHLEEKIEKILHSLENPYGDTNQKLEDIKSGVESIWEHISDDDDDHLTPDELRELREQENQSSNVS